MPDWSIAIDDPRRDDVLTLLQRHLDFARSSSPPEDTLETGSMEAFAPSRALYRGLGFVECEPFGDYSPSRNSTFMTLELR